MTTSATAQTKYGFIGQRILRHEDGRFITGTGNFLDDIVLPDMLNAVVLRSPHAHARLGLVDMNAARVMPGVHLILAHADLVESGLTTVPLDFPPPGVVAAAHVAEQPILAGDCVRFVGDAVAFVVADTLAQARNAAEAIIVEYSELPAVVDIRTALADETLAWKDATTNLVFDFERGDAELVEQAFSQAVKIVSAEIVSNRVDALPLETRACIGSYESIQKMFTLHVSTQRVHILQRALADRIFKVPRSSMRIVAPDTGGGFGQKNGLYPEYVLCLEAARRLRQPVKWVAERSESLQSNCHGRDNLFTVEAALDESDRILAIRATRAMNMGAYTAPRAMVPVLNGLTHLTGAYSIPAASVRVQGVLTNTACTSPYRGAGRPENVFCCERLMDIIAHDLKVDPIEFRRRHVVSPDEMPWVSPLGTTFSDINFSALLDQALGAIDYSGFLKRQREAGRSGLLRGFGICLFAEDLHGSEEPIPAKLKLHDNHLVVMVGSGSAGHGHETSFLQIAAERLGLSMDRLRFVQSDTAEIIDGVGTAASWSITLGGSSVHYAADAAIERGRDLVARRFDVARDEVTFEAGLFRVSRTNRTASWDDIFAADPNFVVSASFEGHGQSVPVGCHACEVEVDPETGQIRIIAFAVAQDPGRMINPMLVEGQLHGGVAQGIGQGWTEAIVYDAAGQLISASLMDYGVLRAADLSNIETVLSETMESTNPLGVKGIGESAATGSTPAFVNAVLQALAPLGVRDIAAPLTSEQIWQSVRAARSGS